MRLTADFSSESMEVSTHWDDIFKGLIENHCQARVLYLAKLLFKMKEKFRHSQINKTEGICC